MKSLALLIAFVLPFSMVSAAGFVMPDWCQLAYDDCQFKFDGHDKVPSFSLDGPGDKPFSPQIVSRNPEERIGIANSNGIPPWFITAGYHVRPFSFYSQAPSMTLFKPYTLPHKIGSGIGHESYDGIFGRRSCIVVHITSYQLLVGEHPPQVRNINLNKSEAKRQKKCVAFKTI